jgi:LysR family transcriptional regulator, chromosome initiation inhibitor
MSLLSPPLQAFLAIVRQGTVHAAAKELRLTQTGVTQRIRALEAQLLTTLFLRSRKGMKLTQEGEALLQFCKGSEELEGQALSQIVDGGKQKGVHLTLVGPTSVVTARVIQQCIPLYHQWPELYLNYIINDNDDCLSQVKSGVATFAILTQEQVPNEMDSKKLKPNRFILAASAQWKGRRLADLLQNERVIDFNQADSTAFNYLKKFDLGPLKRPRLFVNNNDAILRLFIEGVGFGTLTHEIAQPYVQNGDLILLNGGASMEESLALVWYPRTQMPVYFKAIIAAIR